MLTVTLRVRCRTRRNGLLQTTPDAGGADLGRVAHGTEARGRSGEQGVRTPGGCFPVAHGDNGREGCVSERRPIPEEEESAGTSRRRASFEAEPQT